MAKDEYVYQMRPLIYDSKIKPEELTTQAMAWISFPDLLPTFFGKESLFFIAAVVGKPVHLDKVTINKTRPGRARVKVQVDLAAELPRQVEIEVVDNKHNMEESGEDKQKKVRRGKCQDMRWNPIKRRFKKDTNTGEYLLDVEQDQPEAAEGIHLNNNFSTLQEQGEKGTMIDSDDQYDTREENQTKGNEEFTNIQESHINNKSQMIIYKSQERNSVVEQQLGSIVVRDYRNSEDVMSDTLIAQADIVEISLPMGTENEQQRQKLTLSLANAKYHEPIQLYDEMDGNGNLGICSYPTRSIVQQVLQQGNNIQILTNLQTLIPCTKTRPISNLHDIVSHHLQETEINSDKKQESIKKVEDREEDANHGIEMKVHLEADLSPQSSTNNNKSRNKVENKPTKMNPKRSGKETFK
ncbi:hypothetical protein KY290_007730 [Solanum tuberosum]|uniref:DUF4283 domain-containing protein n=1 Tax=Solanum tuberosum TaxID=4113 RepID=A0ABQ7W6I7_SOLTU|nr:hypothetical protein KY290_007730 [Solanum tuberosum]